jgi:hypothetical protein
MPSSFHFSPSPSQNGVLFAHAFRVSSSASALASGHHGFFFVHVFWLHGHNGSSSASSASFASVSGHKASVRL